MTIVILIAKRNNSEKTMSTYTNRYNISARKSIPKVLKKVYLSILFTSYNLYRLVLLYASSIFSIFRFLIRE